MVEDLKNKVEALLFSSGKPMSREELKRICRVRDDLELDRALKDLEVDYSSRDSSLNLFTEDVQPEGKEPYTTYKIAAKHDYIPVVKKVVSETELPKTLLETLAIIAWKYPIKQSDLIAIRTNKAYDHLKELEEKGYISRQKFGRSKIIKLTDKFFNYFDLPPEKVKEKFADFGRIANQIKEKEAEAKLIKEENKKQIEDAKKMQAEAEKVQLEALNQQVEEVKMMDTQGHEIILNTYSPKTNNENITPYPENETVEDPASGKEEEVDYVDEHGTADPDKHHEEPVVEEVPEEPQQEESPESTTEDNTEQQEQIEEIQESEPEEEAPEEDENKELESTEEPNVEGDNAFFPEGGKEDEPEEEKKETSEEDTNSGESEQGEPEEKPESEEKTEEDELPEPEVEEDKPEESEQETKNEEDAISEKAAEIEKNAEDLANKLLGEKPEDEESKPELKEFK